MYRRFVYLNSNIIVKLYEVIIYSSIRKLKHRLSCSIYVIDKIKKKINRVITSRKDGVLDLISINVCESLLISLADNTTFLKIVDNHSRKI